MKKFLSILLALVALAFVYGCAENDSDTAFVPGTINENVYESEWLGLGFTLPEGWDFYSKEEIAELNDLTLDVLDDKTAQQIENAAVFYDMYAIDYIAGNNLNINVEKLSAGIDVDEYIDIAYDQLSSVYGEMGADDSSCDKITATVAGKEYKGVDCVIEFSGISMKQRILCTKIGEYVSCITITSVDGTTIEDICSNFFELK